VAISWLWQESHPSDGSMPGFILGALHLAKKVAFSGASKRLWFSCVAAAPKW